MSAPFATIVIPTHNRAELLESCLAHACSQDYPKKSYEIIVVDDYSTDGTPQLIRMLRKKHRNLHYLRIRRNSPGAARNTGLAKSRGEIVAFTDDDCIVPRGWLSSLVRGFSSTNAAAIGGSLSGRSGRYIARASHLLNFYSWLPGVGRRAVPSIAAANAAYRRKDIGALTFPEFPVDWGYEDSLFNHRLRQKGKMILFCPDITVSHGAWMQGQGMRTFLALQRRQANGFLRGGHAVHGKAGTLLKNIRVLNVLCPAMIQNFRRCATGGQLLAFLYCFPLILLGHLYRGIAILSAPHAPEHGISAQPSPNKTRH